MGGGPIFHSCVSVWNYRIFRYPTSLDWPSPRKTCLIAAPHRVPDRGNPSTTCGRTNCWTEAAVERARNGRFGWPPLSALAGFWRRLLMRHTFVFDVLMHLRSEEDSWTAYLLHPGNTYPSSNCFDDSRL